MSEKKTKAIRRNYLKARITGISIDLSVVTVKELIHVNSLLEAKEKLLASWDSNTEQYLGDKLPRYKCCVSGCSRRLNVRYSFDGQLYCYKHYKQEVSSAALYRCSHKHCNKKLVADLNINQEDRDAIQEYKIDPGNAPIGKLTGLLLLDRLPYCHRHYEIALKAKIKVMDDKKK